MMSSPLAPRIRKSIGVGSAGGLPGSSGAGTPVTPRTRTQIIRTPDSSPAFTLKNAFDRKGGRSSISSPLTTPLRVKQLKRSDSSKDGPLKRVIRKRGWSEKSVASHPEPIIWLLMILTELLIYHRISCFKSPSFRIMSLCLNQRPAPKFLEDSCTSFTSSFAFPHLEKPSKTLHPGKTMWGKQNHGSTGYEIPTATLTRPS